MDNKLRRMFDQVKMERPREEAILADLLRDKKEVRSMRINGKLRTVLAAAAMICLLTAGAWATVTVSPTLRELFGDSAGYSQSSAYIGKSIEKGGWTVTLTDCVGDDRNLYLGFELEAPEGVVLDEDGCQFVDWDFDFLSLNVYGAGGIRSIPDGDPTDNKLQFMLESYDGIGDGYNGVKMRVKLGKLAHNFRWNSEAEERQYDLVCDEEWDFGVFQVDYPDNAIRLTPNVTVHTLDVDAAVTELEVTPLSVHVKIAGEELFGHHNWVPKNAPDHWYGCIEYQEIYLYTEDGEEIGVNDADGASLSGGCSGGETGVDEEAYIVLNRSYHKLIDIDSITAISVCGVMIPLR